MEIFRDTRIDWLKYRWLFMGLSLSVLLLSGLYIVHAGGLRYGIDFSEGTLVYAKFEKTPPLDAIRDRMAAAGLHEAVIQRYDREELNQVMIRTSTHPSEGSDLSSTATSIIAELRTLPGNTLLDSSTEVVGPVVGEQLRNKARNATLAALVAMLVYMAFRFEVIYGVGATVALLHDVLVTLGLLSVFGYEISLNVIAAFLTLVGYSVNDTIVIFDRVRENRQLMRRSSLYDIINVSINQTLRRTILTSGLTFLAVAPLYFLGGEALRPFAFVMLVGIITGTYSTLGIASPIVIWWKHRGRNRSAAAVETPRSALKRV